MEVEKNRGIKYDDLYDVWHKYLTLWNIRLMWPKSVCSKCPAAILAMGKSLDEPDPRCPLSRMGNNDRS